MSCYDRSGEEDDSAILMAPAPAAESANFVSPTVHIRTVSRTSFIKSRLLILMMHFVRRIERFNKLYFTCYFLPY